VPWLKANPLIECNAWAEKPNGQSNAKEIAKSQRSIKPMSKQSADAKHNTNGQSIAKGQSLS